MLNLEYIYKLYEAANYKNTRLGPEIALKCDIINTSVRLAKTNERFFKN